MKWRISEGSVHSNLNSVWSHEMSHISFTKIARKIAPMKSQTPALYFYDTINFVLIFSYFFLMLPLVRIFSVDVIAKIIASECIRERLLITVVGRHEMWAERRHTETHFHSKVRVWITDEHIHWRFWCYQLALPLGRPRNRKTNWNLPTKLNLFQDLVELSLPALRSTENLRRFSSKKHEISSVFLRVGEEETHWHFFFITVERRDKFCELKNLFYRYFSCFLHFFIYFTWKICRRFFTDDL